MPRPTKYILVHEDEVIQQYTVNTLDDLQTAVGGLITSVPLVRHDILPEETTVFANDEGLLIGMRRNTLAEYLTGYPTLVGPVLIGGVVDEEGETQDIADAVILKVFAALEQYFLYDNMRQFRPEEIEERVNHE